MRRRVVLLLALFISSSNAVKPWSVKSWEIRGKDFGSHALFVRDNMVGDDLNMPDYPDYVGISKYLKSKIPIPSEVPELDSATFWRYLYTYDNLSYWYDKVYARPFAAGYEVELVTDKSCISDPDRGSCIGGSVLASVNTQDKKFVRDFRSIDTEPIFATAKINLAYGVRGYIDSSSVTWLNGTGKYNISVGNRPIEYVLLANAANLDLKSKTGPNTRQTLLGKVGTAPVNMLLRRSGSWLWGTYYYDRGRKPAITDRLYVVGEVKNGRFQLREYDLSGYFDRLPTGAVVPTSAVWSGTLSDQGGLKGTVTNSQTKKAFTAALQPQR